MSVFGNRRKKVIKMKILLINPPQKSMWTESFSSVGSIHPSLGLCYIAAVLRENNIDVEILDALVLGMTCEEVVKTVKRKSPDVVGLTAMTPTFRNAIKLAEKIKKHNKNITIVLGGIHVSILPEQTLKENPSIDIGIIGEGENTVLELINAIGQGKNLSKIMGIIFRRKDKLIKTKPRPLIEDLDSIPFPARDLLPPLKVYKTDPANYKRRPSASMITSRGCPFGCIYCDKVIFGRGFRGRSPQNVVDEIQMLIEDYGIREITFFDELITASKKRVIDICDQIVKRNLDIIWTCESRVDTIDLELLKKMKRAGCWQISYGIESGSQKVLDYMKKGVTIKQVEKCLKLTKSVGMKTRGYFMFGFPIDTVETIGETINFAKKLSLDHAQFSCFIPFPGTKLHELVENEGFKDVDWVKYKPATFDPVYVPKNLTYNQLAEAIRGVHKEFYLRPKYILSQLMDTRTIEDLKRNIRGALAVLSM